MNAAKPAKPATPLPLTAVQQFYSTHSPADAIRLALAEHAAQCQPMSPMGDFTRALNKALERTEAYPELVAYVRTVRDAHGANDVRAVAARALLAKLGEGA